MSTQARKLPESVTWENPFPAGLPKVIYDTLKAHPEWERDEDGRVVCAGPECAWRKSNRNSIQHQWLQHQKFVLLFAIGAAGFEFNATEEGSE